MRIAWQFNQKMLDLQACWIQLEIKMTVGLTRFQSGQLPMPPGIFEEFYRTTGHIQFSDQQVAREQWQDKKTQVHIIQGQIRMGGRPDQQMLKLHSGSALPSGPDGTQLHGFGEMLYQGAAQIIPEQFRPICEKQIGGEYQQQCTRDQHR